MSIFSNLFRPPKNIDQIVARMSSETRFADLKRCSCGCGQPVNADSRVEVLENETFLAGHIPDDFKVYAAQMQSQREAAVFIAARDRREAANLKNYNLVAEALRLAKENEDLLSRIRLDPPLIVEQLEAEIEQAGKLLTPDQRQQFGLPPLAQSSAIVIPPGKP